MADTRLDAAHAAMQAAPEAAQPRLRFYEQLAGGELFLLLDSEASGADITPQVFEVEGVSYVLAFDLEDRLTAFTGHAAPYAALTGRALAEMLVPHGLGLALNPGAAASAHLIPPEAIGWLHETLGNTPGEIEERIDEFSPPGELPETLLQAIDARLAAAAGLAHCAYLTRTTYRSGATGHLLGFIDTRPGAEPALARAISEVLSFSGLEAAALDVAFFSASDPAAARLARTGLRFDLPQPEAGLQPAAPGSDPAKPPRL